MRKLSCYFVIFLNGTTLLDYTANMPVFFVGIYIVNNGESLCYSSLEAYRGSRKFSPVIRA